jgi:hypothetical protein
VAGREREREGSWAGSGCSAGLGPGCGPVGLLPPFFYFFSMFSFSFVFLKTVLDFEYAILF